MIAQHSYMRTLIAGVIAALMGLAVPVTFVKGATTTTDVEGPEPGAGCEAAGAGSVCTPAFGAPLSGTAMIEWLDIDGDGDEEAVFSGVLTEFGAGNCKINVPPDKAITIDGIDRIEEFRAIRNKDLRQFCIEEITVEADTEKPGICRSEFVQFAEVLAAGRMMSDRDTMFSVHVLALPIDCD